MPHDPPASPLYPEQAIWLSMIYASFSVRDKELARHLNISVQYWRKIRTGKAGLSYERRQRVKALIHALAQPEEYTLWLHAEPPVVKPLLKAG